MLFTELSLHPDLQKGIEASGYSTCMPVQEQVFVNSFQGHDICAQSQTGTGKTAAFLVSIFQRMLTDPASAGKKAFILAPTRELAVQIQDEAEKLGAATGISSGCFYGGVGYGQQYDMLRDNVRIIIGTPGRIIDLIQQGRLVLADVGFLVVDEADRMFDMGFIDDLRRILRYLPPPERRQSFLFSATLGMRIKDLAWEYMKSPVEVVIEPERVTVDLVAQELYHVGVHEKFRFLLGILAREKPKSAIVFCNQKNMAEEVARRLSLNGIDCDYIMGDLPQSRRSAIIENLKSGNLEILVATDVAARGLDIEGLDLVVNFDIPNEAETYVHRIGRTARAGKSGKAITLACERFVYGLPAVEEFIGQKIPVFTFSEELLAEDKSSRMHYHQGREGPGRGSSRTGSRDGRDRSRPAGKPGTRPGHAHGAPSGESRGPARRVADPVGQVEGMDSRTEGKFSRNPERNDQRPSIRSSERMRSQTADTFNQSDAPVPGIRNAPAGANPYSMSQDERMRRYREKYASGTMPERSADGSIPHSGNRADSSGNGSITRKGPSGTALSRESMPRGVPQSPSRAIPGKSAPHDKSSIPGSPGTASAGSGPVTGLWSRIKAIFTGRRKD